MVPLGTHTVGLSPVAGHIGEPVTAAATGWALPGAVGTVSVSRDERDMDSGARWAELRSRRSTDWLWDTGHISKVVVPVSPL